ncbi:hypothetical protein HAX54_022727 [Datura stramonium]|uniref:Uncharacterized protein n=1 Tax=Datura stramonium TaxID=4076 RepID=A0ABS8UWB4_DATST|nr:hypothetical protein [Datura stramonium]
MSGIQLDEHDLINDENEEIASEEEEELFDSDDSEEHFHIQDVRFDPHKPVIEGIANCIRSKFELAKPSWKKFHNLLGICGLKNSRSQVHESNAKLYNQLQEERRQNKFMRRQNEDMRKKLSDTNKKLDALMKHVRYPVSSNAQPSSPKDSESSESDENNGSDNLNDEEFRYLVD